MCSGREYGEGKIFLKENIVFNDKSITVCFNKKIFD